MIRQFGTVVENRDGEIKLLRQRGNGLGDMAGTGNPQFRRGRDGFLIKPSARVILWNSRDGKIPFHSPADRCRDEGQFLPEIFVSGGLRQNHAIHAAAADETVIPAEIVIEQHVKLRRPAGFQGGQCPRLNFGFETAAAECADDFSVGEKHGLRAGALRAGAFRAGNERQREWLTGGGKLLIDADHREVLTGPEVLSKKTRRQIQMAIFLRANRPNSCRFPLHMNEWNIQSRAPACELCAQPFADRQPYHTLLLEEPPLLRRSDICESCWQKPAAAAARGGSGFISHWQGIFEVPPPVQDVIQKETAETILRKLIEQNEPSHAPAAYILAVMLERKRLLKVKEQLLRDGRRVFIYEQPRTGDIFTIADPDLHLDQLEEVQRDVARLLEHGLNPPAAEPRVPAVEPAAADQPDSPPQLTEPATAP